MANETKILQFPQPPLLPIATVEYRQQYQDQYSNALRLYFNQLSSVFNTELGPLGGRFLNNPYGSFYDTTDQTAASTTTAYAITYNTTDLSNGVTIVSSSQITFAYTGLYNIQFSVQLSNNDNAPQDVDIWFRKNGTDIANSNSRFGLAARKSVGDPFHIVGALNFFVSVAANDYIQLMWRTSNTGVQIEYYAAGTTPTRPAIPSVILTTTFVSSVIT